MLTYIHIYSFITSEELLTYTSVPCSCSDFIPNLFHIVGSFTIEVNPCVVDRYPETDKKEN